jgi:uncharacterized protein YciI
MASPNEIPDGIAIERVFVVEATYAPDAAETRPRVRPEHLARVRRLMDEGVITESGGYLDLSTALVFVRAKDEQAALEIAREDVYMREGIWVELRVRPFGRVELTAHG